MYRIDKYLQDYYENRFTMFSTQAWKDLEDDVEVLKGPIADIRTVKTEEALHFRRGQLDIIEWLLGLKEISEKAYQDLKE